MTARIETPCAIGTFSLDGQTFDVRAAPELAERLSAELLLHPDDRVLWDLTHTRREPDGALRDGMALKVAGTAVHVLHTPGHSPGAVCFSMPDLGVVFSGDTLFAGGPGATGRSYSDYPTILDSIRTRLFALPPETIVHIGHGDDTTVGAEAPAYDQGVARESDPPTVRACGRRTRMAAEVQASRPARSRQRMPAEHLLGAARRALLDAIATP